MSNYSCRFRLQRSCVHLKGALWSFLAMLFLSNQIVSVFAAPYSNESVTSTNLLERGNSIWSSAGSFIYSAVPENLVLVMGIAATIFLGVVLMRAFAR